MMPMLTSHECGDDFGVKSRAAPDFDDSRRLPRYTPLGHRRPRYRSTARQCRRQNIADAVITIRQRFRLGASEAKELPRRAKEDATSVMIITRRRRDDDSR